MNKRMGIIALMALLVLVVGSSMVFAETIQYTYDKLNRLIKEQYPDGTTVTHTYDEAGNRKSVEIIPFNLDSDGDGLTDAIEATLGTDPYDADTDDDGIPDGLEDANHNGVVDAGETSALLADSDGDGIQDGTELGYTLAMVGPDTDTGVFVPDADPTTTTNPLSNDTDGDGIPDGVEDANANGRVDPFRESPAQRSLSQ